jgi:hypothetical protein
MHEVMQTEVYVGMTQFNEFVVTYAGKGVDLKPEDYITHADRTKLLTGSLADFLESGNRETVVNLMIFHNIVRQ